MSSHHELVLGDVSAAVRVKLCERLVDVKLLVQIPVDKNHDAVTLRLSTRIACTSQLLVQVPVGKNHDAVTLRLSTRLDAVT
jgi:hypothetical protein